MQPGEPTVEGAEPWTTAKLKPREFAALSRTIEELSGIRIPAGKQVLVEVRLRRRLHALNMHSFAEYCAHIISPAGRDEIGPMIDEITTNTTEFFREPHHFDFLAHEGLPSLAKLGAGTKYPLRAWSAACSSGEEPYSLAMVLADFAASQPGYDYSILGTDICTEVLQKAQRAVYPEDHIEPIPKLMRERHLLRSKDRSSRLVRMAPHVRAHVTFRRLNFLDGDYQIEAPMDVILCRNALIYFGRDTQRAICAHLCRHLRSGGYFFLGHSEALQGMLTGLTMLAPTIYRKDDESSGED